ncbi:MAG: DEAD/DEAH box helicase [Sulfurimonadaceae bacterium]|jgi:ATP-dependent RNA helicase RhlE|nr:DEAD/DEAH box helicase [Sulfurimonadaceae bacterium]
MTFKDLNLSEPLLKAITAEGYTAPTPVQKQAIPFILAGRDMLAGAQTGTGKTAGFTLPILELMSKNKPAKRQLRALILTPTRELAAQVAESVKIYGKYLPFKSTVVFGGVGINPQIKTIAAGVDILVATPGRLMDLIGQKALDISGVEFFVLDEADRMLDMGFINDIRKVIAMLPKKRQNLLFSATYSPAIRTLASTLLNNPAEVEVARPNSSNEQVTQSVIIVDDTRKSSLLGKLIAERDMRQVLVFTRTKHRANKLTEYLQKINITAAAIHGNKSQAARTRALQDFKNGSVRVLVATDIAARGIDIDLLPQVINYELPNIAEDYVHRIGRTGRAGSSGEALSLVCVDEHEYLRQIEKLIKKTFDRQTVEGFEPDPTILAKPILQGGGGNRQRSNSGGNSRSPSKSNSRNSPRR